MCVFAEILGIINMFSEMSNNSLDPLLNIKHSFLRYPVVHCHILHTQGLCSRLPPPSVSLSVRHSLPSECHTEI